MTAALLRNIGGYWRATNYLSVGQAYLYDILPLKTPLKPAQINTQRMVQEYVVEVCSTKAKNRPIKWVILPARRTFPISVPCAVTSARSGRRRGLR